jgi:hypothetical protein
MDKTITTALLIVISMVTAIMLFNVVYPAVVEGGDAITSMASRTEDRMRSQIQLIHASGELNQDGVWQDTNGNGQFEVFLWVKNIGDTRITSLDSLDIFFGPAGNFQRIPLQANAGGATPNWTWAIENGTEWVPTGTLRITVHYINAQASGQYFAKVTTSNGVSDDLFLGL